MAVGVTSQGPAGDDVVRAACSNTGRRAEGMTSRLVRAREDIAACEVRLYHVGRSGEGVGS